MLARKAVAIVGKAEQLPVGLNSQYGLWRPLNLYKMGLLPAFLGSLASSLVFFCLIFSVYLCLLNAITIDCF